jgi:hypothetical protein
MPVPKPSLEALRERGTRVTCAGCVDVGARYKGRVGA